MTAQINPDTRRACSRTCLPTPSLTCKRYGTAAEVANVVLWLMSDEAEYVSGALHLIDGALQQPADWREARPTRQVRGRSLPGLDTTVLFSWLGANGTGGYVYRVLYAVLLRRIPPEEAHRAFRILADPGGGGVPGLAWALRRVLGPREPSLRVRAFGLKFTGPRGLAAGVDKDGEGVIGLAARGFSFNEVGTVTARPQPGNLKPRMFRFADERALVNRMGFNNHGAAALSARLRALRARPGFKPVIGVNIGKTKAVPEEEAVADYVTSARLVADVADYVVVNVSSPNTPGLRDLQAADKLRPILTGVRTALDQASPRAPEPLLVKIAPDLADPDVDAVADLALELGLDGIIATNTTISREACTTSAAVADRPGGLSDPPMKQRSLRSARLHDQVRQAPDAHRGRRHRHMRRTRRTPGRGRDPAPGLHRLHLRGSLLAQPRSAGPGRAAALG